MMIENYLHSGKTIYKLYHGYNFTPLLELLNKYDYAFQTLYQANGYFKLWFINKLDTSKRIRIIEDPRNSSFIIFSFIADPEDTECFYPATGVDSFSNKIVIKDYFTKKKKLSFLKMDLIELKLIETENLFRESNA